MMFPLGVSDPRYSLEVDNFMQLTNFLNFLVSPIYDYDTGDLVGVVQLINKLNNEPVTAHDLHELKVIAPTLGGIMQFCNSSNDVS